MPLVFSKPVGKVGAGVLGVTCACAAIFSFSSVAEVLNSIGRMIKPKCVGLAITLSRTSGVGPQLLPPTPVAPVLICK